MMNLKRVSWKCMDVVVQCCITSGVVAYILWLQYGPRKQPE